MSDIIYILTNETFPGLVKIGFTTNLDERIRTLSTSVPEEFECYYSCEVEEGTGRDVERRLHTAFEDLRVPKKEFFKIKPRRVKAVLELLAVQNTTSDRYVIKNRGTSNRKNKKPLDRKKSRRPSERRKSGKAPLFTFSMVNIPMGSELTLLEDKTKTAKVVGERKIKYKGRIDFISTITQDIFNNELGINWSAVRGANHWLFEGETLSARRARFEDSSD